MTIVRNWVGNLENIYHESTQQEKAQISEVRAEYFIPIIPKETSNETSNECAICLEEDSKPKVYFCPSHAFHVDCLAQNFFAKSKQLLTSWHATRKVSEGHVSYPSSIVKEALASCPQCRGTPIVDHQLRLEIKEVGSSTSKWSGRVELREKNMDPLA